VKPVLPVDVADQFDGSHGVSLADSNDQIIASARLERRHQFPSNSEGLRSCQDLRRHLWIL